MADAEGPQPDLSACHAEPIHIPGAIQPHGVLLALGPEMRVSRAAGDLRGLLGVEGDPLGRPLGDLVDLGAVVPDAGPGEAAFAGTVAGAAGKPLDLFAHRAGDELIVELEPAPVPRITAARVLSDLLPIVGGIAGAGDLGRAAGLAAAGVRQITGYDRVMVYRFLDDGSGQVIAESLAGDLEPFLNHRYPASDIPEQARALYLRNPIRVIPDVGYGPGPVVGGEGPLDLGGALLRSVSPVHIQYLKNMGVGASASVSLVRNGALWGLIACHHRSPRGIVHEAREMCRRVALALEQAVGRLEEENSQREALRLTRRREELLPNLAAADGVAAGLRANLEEVRRLIPADGLVLVLDGEVVSSGSTPPEAAIRDVALWLLQQPGRDHFQTDALSRVYAPAADWTASASGLLACIVSRAPRLAVLWFRAEEVETVNWAGNPHKAAEQGSGGLLSPRTSFELWAETVRGRSRPWRPNERDAARRLAASLADIALQQALSEHNRRLTGQVAEKDLLMREVHHRVQNSLQLVTSMLHLQERDVQDDGARAQLELARDRVMSVSMLHRRLWRSEDLESVNLETFFAELVEGLVQTWPDAWRTQVTLDIEPVRLPSHEALLIALVVTELLTNAVKHAYGGGAGPVSIAGREAGRGRFAIAVSDRGIGTSGEARTGSFGSRLVQRLVGNVRGELKVEPNDPGTSITLTVPIRSA